MKKAFSFALLAVAFAGCCSYTAVIRPTVTSVRSDDGVRPVATVSVFNVSYSLFGLLPIESGETWKGLPGTSRDGWNWTWFEDRCTLDENLASVRAACKEVGSNKIMNLVTDTDIWSFWSLFIIRRKVMKSTCTVID